MLGIVSCCGVVVSMPVLQAGDPWFESRWQQTFTMRVFTPHIIWQICIHVVSYCRNQHLKDMTELKPSGLGCFLPPKPMKSARKPPDKNLPDIHYLMPTVRTSIPDSIHAADCVVWTFFIELSFFQYEDYVIDIVDGKLTTTPTPKAAGDKSTSPQR